MNITVNGNPTDLTTASLADLLRDNGIAPGREGIAVALNDAIVPRGRWEATWLSDGDVVEIITAMQGG